jgi:hypothetical protein
MSVSSTAHGQEIEQGKELVRMLIRIWPARSNAPSGWNEDANCRGQMLTDDLLSSMLVAKTDHGRRGYVCAWGINELSRTLAAARALQEAFDEFRVTTPAMKTTISVVLDRSPAGEPEAHCSRPSLELTSLLDAASPGQVLITQSFYKCIDGCQPLQLRSFPPRAGVYEWLWTSTERLDRLHSDLDFGPTLVEEPRAAAITAAVPTIGFALPNTASTVPLQAASTETNEAITANSRLGKFRSRKAAIAAVLAVAVAAGAGAMLWLRRPADHVKEALGAGRVVLPEGLEAEIDWPGPEGAEIPLAGKVDVFLPAARYFRPPGEWQEGNKCTIEGQFQMQKYLELAERNRNEGQYEASIREYNEVLACQPWNRAAKEGKARALEDSAGH